MSNAFRRIDNLARFEHEGIGTRPASERIGAVSAGQDIIAAAAVQHVVPGATSEHIVARAATQSVIAATAEEGVVTEARPVVCAAQGVVAGSGGHRIAAMLHRLFPALHCV